MVKERGQNSKKELSEEEKKKQIEIEGKLQDIVKEIFVSMFTESGKFRVFRFTPETELPPEAAESLVPQAEFQDQDAPDFVIIDRVDHPTLVKVRYLKSNGEEKTDSEGKNWAGYRIFIVTPDRFMFARRETLPRDREDLSYQIIPKSLQDKYKRVIRSFVTARTEELGIRRATHELGNIKSYSSFKQTGNPGF